MYRGKDFTIHASIDGVVSFAKKNILRYDGRKYLKTVVEVLPVSEQSVVAPAKKTPAKKSPVKATTEKKIPVAKKVVEKKTPAKKKVSTNDDLTKIEGIGPKIQEVFNTAGLMTYADLSSAKVGDLRTLLADNGLSQHDPKTWKKQATLAKNDKWEELKVLQDELDGGKAK